MSLRAKRPEDRKTLLSIAKKSPAAIRELLAIRGDAAVLKEEFDTYADADRTLKLMKKKKAALFISHIGESHLVLGRSYDGQFIDLVKFKIQRMLSSSDFQSLAAEVHVKYFLLFQGIADARLENLLADAFHQSSREVDLCGLRYAWIFHQHDRLLTLKFVRVLKDMSVADVGPFFELAIEKEYFCGEDLWSAALDVKKVKKVKNTEKNVFKDRIGKVHVDRQDLKDIKLKKNRGRKNKLVTEAADDS